MTPNCVVFILSDTEYLDLCFELSLAELLPCDDILISFHGEITIRLYYNFADEGIRRLITMLRECLNNNIKIDPELTKILVIFGMRR